MHQTARDAYLEAETRTATPQRLRLMLIDGAIRFARLALENWTSERMSPDSYQALVRCRSIITELCGSIKADNPVAQKVKEVYLFLFRQLAEAPAYNDPQRIRDVIEVLEEERETWRQVCEKMPEVPHREDAALHGCQEITATGMRAVEPHAPGIPAAASPPIDRFSLEA